MRKVVVASAEATRIELEQGGRRLDTILLTCTYREDADYDPGQVSECARRLVQWCARRGVKPVIQWVIELTQRGRPHYHLLIWVPLGFQIPMADRQGWWPHGMTRTEKAERPVGYLIKYASKGIGCEDRIPFGARLFGVRGLSEYAKLSTHRAALPRWLSDRTAGRCSRIAGGWLVADTGEFITSPYRLRWGYDLEGNAFVEVLELAQPSMAA